MTTSTTLSQFPFEIEVQYIFNYLSEWKYPENLSINNKRSMRRRSETFRVDGNRLMYIGASKDAERRVITDAQEQQKKIKILHEGFVGGHFERDRTKAKVLERYHWRDISDDVIRYVQRCESCQKAARNFRKAGQLHPIPVTGVSDQVGVDVIGPLSETANGNKYIITLSDYFSKWVEAVAVKDKKAETTANFLFETMARFKYMSQVLLPHAIQWVYERRTGRTTEYATGICREY